MLLSNRRNLFASSRGLALKSVFILAAILIPLAAPAQEFRFSVVLHPYLAGSNNLDPDPGFDVDAAGDVWIHSGQEIHNLNQNQNLEPYPLIFENLSGFRVADDGTVLAVRGKFLSQIRDGVVSDILQLPVPGMKIARTGHRFWLYGGDSAPNTGLYLVTEDGKHRKILEAEAPITAVDGIGDTIFFAMGNLIHRADFGHEIALIAAVPGSPITSLAYDPDHGNLFLAQGKSVFILAAGELNLLARGLADEIIFRHGALYAYVPDYMTIVRIQGIMDLKNPDVAPAAEQASSSSKPTLAQVQYQKATELAADGKDLQAYWALKQVIALEPDWAEPYHSAGALCEHLGYTRDFRFIGQAAKFYQGFLDRAAPNDPQRAQVSAKIEALTYIDQWMPASEGGKYVTPQDVGLAGGGVLVWALLCMFMFF